jgi:hypothetical protein
MGDAVELEVTAEQGNWLFQRIAGFELPDKLGEVKYDNQTRSGVKEDCRIAARIFRKQSYYAVLVGDENRLVFGAEDNWKKDEKDPGGLRMVNASRVYKLSLCEDAVSGLMWLFYALLTPSQRKEDGTLIHSSISPIMAEIFVWPVVEKLHKVNALRAALGLMGVKSKGRWTDDAKSLSE